VTDSLRLRTLAVGFVTTASAVQQFGKVRLVPSTVQDAEADNLRHFSIASFGLPLLHVINVEARVSDADETRADGEPDKMRVVLRSDLALNDVVMVPDRLRAEVE
jgi:hypothetical protein